MVLVLLLGFIGLFFGITSYDKTEKSIPSRLIVTILYFSFLVVLSTEVLSYFSLITRNNIFIFWLPLALFGVYKILSDFKRIKHFFLNQKQSFIKLPIIIKIGCSVGLLYLIIILITGLIYPPNNWDSMTYHLSRVLHWANQQSVEHYATSIYRQLHLSPFSEYFILHILLLENGDLLAFFPQTIYLLFSCLVVFELDKVLNFSKLSKVLVVLLVLFTPEIILQGSSTQNDLVVSFFLLTALLFTFKLLNKYSLKNVLIVALSISIAAFTKGTAFIYGLPIIILVIFSAIKFMGNHRTLKPIVHLPLTLFLFIAVNGAHLYRNYNLTANVLGVDKEVSQLYANQNLSFIDLFSNVVRNASLHFGVKPINKIVEKSVIDLHEVMGLNASNPDITFGAGAYIVEPYMNHEDYAANLIQVCLFILALFLLLNALRNKERIISANFWFLFGVVICQGLIFCIYLKWQVWHSRLHTPLFFLILLVIAYLLQIQNKKVLYVGVFVAFGYSLIMEN